MLGIGAFIAACVVLISIVGYCILYASYFLIYAIPIITILCFCFVLYVIFKGWASELFTWFSEDEPADLYKK
jgi:hypothetical protein